MNLFGLEILKLFENLTTFVRDTCVREYVTKIISSMVYIKMKLQIQKVMIIFLNGR